MLRSCGVLMLDIVLDQPQGVYVSGQKVTGKVHIVLENPIEALGIKLNHKGEAHVSFTDRSAGFRRSYTAGEIYYDEEHYLQGDGSTKFEISKGEHFYPFSLMLPEKLPCSFEGRYGRLRYTIKVKVGVTDILDLSHKIPFTVVSLVDLNEDHLATLPISEDNTKMYMGQSEPVNMLVSLPVRGYVPGQTIPVKINLNNESSVEVRKLRILFKKVVTYHTLGKSKNHKEVIVEIDLPIVENCHLYETGVDVPSLPPTGMIFCSIIDVRYTLKVEACVEINEWYFKMFQKNLKTRMEIIIGTVPLRNYESPEENEEKSLLPKTCDESPLSTSNVSRTPEVPNYEESQQHRSSKPDKDGPIENDEDSDDDVKPYAPMYRVYKFRKTKKVTASN